MVKIKYVGMSGSIATSGIQFMKGKPYEVTEEVAKYLKDSFGKNFEVIEEAKVEVKAEPVVEEVKPKVVRKPRAKRVVKPKVEEEK